MKNPIFSPKKTPLYLLALSLAWLVASPVAAQTSSAQEQEKLVVMPLKSSRLSQDTVSLLDELLVAAVREFGEYSVVGRADLEAMIGLESLKDQLGCDDTTCAAEIGGALGARFLLSGRVAKLGDSVIVMLRIIDTDKQSVTVESKYTMVDDENVYDSGLSAAVAKLFNREAPPEAESEPGEIVVGVEGAMWFLGAADPEMANIPEGNTVVRNFIWAGAVVGFHSFRLLGMSWWTEFLVGFSSAREAHSDQYTGSTGSVGISEDGGMEV